MLEERVCDGSFLLTKSRKFDVGVDGSHSIAVSKSSDLETETAQVTLKTDRNRGKKVHGNPTGKIDITGREVY